jgi:N-acetylglucosaminyldiphosphoundecaprenol N-acetyl-beta-D-mannosaminyltransferase
LKETILGVKVCRDSYDQLAQKILNDIEQKNKSLIVAVNPEKIMKAQEDEALLRLLNEAAYQIPDGIGVILASRLNKGEIKERVTGIDMMLKLCELAQNHQKKIFLYGAKPGVAAAAKEKLEERFPGIQIAGTENGYETDQEKIISSINDSKADILFVAMGSPRQENWINSHMDELAPSIYQGVGGSFDVICGNIKRAPIAFQKAGLEWFYRLLLEPSRWKRQLILPKFLITTLKAKR